jgi:VCBS repeat-containing protein
VNVVGDLSWTFRQGRADILSNQPPMPPKPSLSFHALLTGAALVLSLAGCSSGQSNRPPEVDSFAVAGAEDTEITAQFRARDRDRDALTFNVTRPPSHGTLSLDSNGSFKYTPPTNFNGQDSFEITASDAEASSSAATVQIEIAAANDAPVAQAPAELSADEDSVATGLITGTDIDGDTLSFFVSSTPAHGSVVISENGSFEYRPAPDFNGQDQFDLGVRDGVASATVTVKATIGAVNDPLVLGVIADATNSAETFTTRLILPLKDVDGDLASVITASDRTDIATVTYDPSAKQLVLTPVEYGLASITVTATDGVAPVSQTFDFSVQDVTKTRAFTIAAEQVQKSAISLRNDSDRDVDFVLEHKGFPVFESTAHMVQFVTDMPAELPEEPFERKLWRFVRDSTNHYYPLMPVQFTQAPWGTMNSTGFGFCADMATSYVAIAKAAGYEARVWSLYNHVIPEIRVDGRWQVYDPDLGIYYFNRSGAVAGVAELAADPELIRTPTTPILPLDAFPYSETTTDFYATTSNNILADFVLLPAIQDVAGRFNLPPGATLTYPGRWTDPPIAYEVFASLLTESELPAWRTTAAAQGTDIPIPIPFHRQAKIDLAEGWTGTLSLPLWLWEIQGSGGVRIDGNDYAIGSDELAERLQRRVPVRVLEITQGSNVRLIMQINFVMFDMDENTSIEVTGRDVWAVTATPVGIGDAGAGEKWAAGRQKAVP